MQIMKKNILALVVTLFLFSLYLVSATVTVTNPGASATLTATVVVNATGVNLLNCTFYAKSASTANSTWATLGFFVNATAGAINVNGTFSSLVLEDSNDYVFNATCTNQTNSLHEGTRTGITIQNTIPQAPSSLSPVASSISSNTSVAFSGTVTDRNTTGCTLYFVGKNPGATSYAMTYATTGCTKTISGFPEETYTYYIQATDGTDTTNSAQTTFQIRRNSQGEVIQPIDQTTTSTVSNENGRILGVPIWLIVLIIVAILVIWIVNKR